MDSTEVRFLHRKWEIALRLPYQCAKITWQ